ncbi:MAG TPA: OmpH family outer membrane protein [Bacteroidales bacterium]|nr:OmpH family outer membrane protein [Bacteroidales bacterium]
MKDFKGLLIIMLVIFSGGQMATAQNLKFGHINSDEIIQALPDFDTARVKLDKFRNELISHLELMSKELNSKNDAYQKKNKNLSELVRQVKERELNDMNRRIQEFQNNAQNQLQEKQAELFQPVYLKVEKAIKDVGKENGFLYVFDTSEGGSLAYFNEAQSTNVTPLVKAKLKIK